MKMKTSALLAACVISLSSAYAAQELPAEKAVTLKPFDRISITGHFNTISDAVAAVSAKADKLGADYFYIQGTSSNSNHGGNLRVTADLYHSDAKHVEPNVERSVYNGVTELSKKEADSLMPYDTVTVKGFFPTQQDVLQAIGRQAATKEAAAFHIVRQIEINNRGGNQNITAFIYKADAPKRLAQLPDAIPADSEAGVAALSQGGEAAAKVEIPGVATSSEVNVGRFFETQSSKGGRYTVTLADGNKIQELNRATAAQMVPFDSVTFTGHFNSGADISQAVAKKAAEKSAKYYHITRQWQNKSGGNLTISADLFK